MNVPNSLTLLRIILIPVFVIILMVRMPYGDYFAAAVFIVATLTDSLDGYLARKWKQVTKLGIVLDPIADKLLITAALIILVQLGRIHGWIAIVILGREFAVSGLRIVKAEEGVIIPASKLGKIKTVSQVIAVLLIILEKAYQPYIPLPLGPWAMYFAVIITILSGVEYFYRFQLHK
ncbi:MAG: CDP-diacylglycerol--glycerol-3-phosphate 3-phosphatidyltransferase [Syntrophomonadaceae bacterium]|nr:CDP-diacylglycerol--glycerol-3-phosphate 3-phosphatidyltransferase [Syntrophomonadaceae bacterium]MDD3023866.1 CDP-diacylglycerol--glycerol-3-phosphate 3-phosphatidyltransferase [Syntrophomonadaceae bacterium]